MTRSITVSLKLTPEEASYISDCLAVGHEDNDQDGPGEIVDEIIMGLNYAVNLNSHTGEPQSVELRETLSEALEKCSPNEETAGDEVQVPDDSLPPHYIRACGLTP